MEYLLMILFFLITGIIILWKCNLKIFSSKKEAITIIGLLFLVGVICDSIAVWKGYWIYQNVFSFRIGFLPLEEYLFYLVLPLWVIIIYRLIHKN